MNDTIGLVLDVEGIILLQRGNQSYPVQALTALFAGDRLVLKAGTKLEALLFSTQKRWQLTTKERTAQTVVVEAQRWQAPASIELRPLGSFVTGRGRVTPSLPPVKQRASRGVPSRGTTLEPQGRVLLTGNTVLCRWSGLESSLPVQLVLWKTLSSSRAFQKTVDAGQSQWALAAELLTPGESYCLATLQRTDGGGKRTGYSTFTPLTSPLQEELEALLRSAETPLLRAVALETYGLLGESLKAYESALTQHPSPPIRDRKERLEELLGAPEPRA